MSAIILRRKKLGKTSCNKITEYMQSSISVVRNDRGIPQAEKVIRWGCTSSLGYEAKEYNKSNAIHFVNNKTQFRKILNDYDLCPVTWFTEDNLDVVDYPVIVRPNKHAQGRHLYVCETDEELNHAIEMCGEDHYVSEYIPKVAEYRVMFIHGRVAWVASKIPVDYNAIAWNVAQGGKFKNVRWNNWPIEVINVAHSAFMLSGLDFGGVDVIVSSDGDCYVLEINSAPSHTSPYRQQATAKCFDWMLSDKLVEPVGCCVAPNYKSYIHPALVTTEELDDD